MNHPDDLTPNRGREADAWRICGYCESALGYVFTNGRRVCVNCGRTWISRAEREKASKHHGR